MVLGSADHPDWIAIKISCNLGDYSAVREAYRGTAYIGALARPHAAGWRVFEHPTAFPTPHGGSW